MHIEQIIASGLVAGAIYALIAMCIVILYKVTGIINFAQGEFVMLGAMIVITLVDAGMNQLLAACLTVLIVMIISMGIYGAAFYPLRNTKNVLSNQPYVRSGTKFESRSPVDSTQATGPSH
jgi:branched-chain amino acid transport system permease protein